MTAGFTIRRARPEDDAAVVRELAAYLAFIGDAFEPEGLDHDIAHWQEEYCGATGALSRPSHASFRVLLVAMLAFPAANSMTPSRNTEVGIHTDHPLF